MANERRGYVIEVEISPGAWLYLDPYGGLTLQERRAMRFMAEGVPVVEKGLSEKWPACDTRISVVTEGVK